MTDERHGYPFQNPLCDPHPVYDEVARAALEASNDLVGEMEKALSELRDWTQATAPHGDCEKPLGCITCGFVKNADKSLSRMRDARNGGGDA